MSPIPKTANESALDSIRAHLAIALDETNHIEPFAELELLRSYLRRGEFEVRSAGNALKRAQKARVA